MREEKRKTRLAELIGVIESGKDVALRDIKAALTTAEFENMQRSWKDQVEQRAYFKDKPSAVIEYEELLHKAQFIYNKMEGYSGSFRRSGVRGKDGVRVAKKLSDKADTAFEKALLRLEEMASMDSYLHIWFDRPLDFDAGSELGPGPMTMPLVITSRSMDKQSAGMLQLLQTKRSIKQEALEMALEALKPVIAADAAEDAAAIETAMKLRTWLKKRR